jgi:hypothetical protein
MSFGLLILTITHVVISLAGIGAGFVVIRGFLTGDRLDRWTAAFLAATILTSVTGFAFPVNEITPGHIIGVLSLIALGVALWSRYGKGMAGRWRATFVICAMVSQYFNFTVLIIQLFGKVPVLHELAPTPAAPVFLITHIAILALFVGLTYSAVFRFRIRNADPAETVTTGAAIS